MVKTIIEKRSAVKYANVTDNETICKLNEMFSQAKIKSV